MNFWKSSRRVSAKRENIVLDKKVKETDGTVFTIEAGTDTAGGPGMLRTSGYMAASSSEIFGKSDV